MSGIQFSSPVTNQKASPAVYASSLATRPAPQLPGRIFVDTDNPSTGMYRDTGTVWVQIAETGASDTDTLQSVTDRGNTTDNTLILTYDSTFNGSNAIEFFDVGTTATRYSITKQGTGNRLTIQGNSPLSTNDMGIMIDALQNTLRSYWGSSFDSRGFSCDFTNNIYRLGNVSGTSGQQGIYINSSGNVGIGTTSPTAGYKLDVSGNAQIINPSATTTLKLGNGAVYTGTIDFGNSYISQTSGPLLTIQSNTTLDLSTSFATRVRIASNGNVLIGTTTDGGQKLQVSGGAAVAAVFENSGTNAGLRISNSTYPYLVLNRSGTINRAFGIFNASGDIAIQESATWSGAYYHIFYGTGGYSTTGSGHFGNNVAANASAVLEATSTTKGLLLPRMTTAQVNAIVTPANGLLVYNTTIDHFCGYQAGAWVKFSHSPM